MDQERGRGAEGGNAVIYYREPLSSIGLTCDVCGSPAAYRVALLPDIPDAITCHFEYEHYEVRCSEHSQEASPDLHREGRDA